jgi:hypothetical protein
MQMPGRKYQASPDSKYRYSINGQEKSDELNENLTAAMYWEYDSRISRRWNVDPVIKVWESPYLCFSGNPISIVDLNGDKGDDIIDVDTKSKRVTILKTSDNFDIVTYSFNPEKKIKLAKGSFKVEEFEKMGYSIWHPYPTGDGAFVGAVEWLAGEKIASVALKGLGKLVTKGIVKLSERAAAKAARKFIGESLANVTAHLEQFGIKAENTVMLDRMKQIANKKMVATEIDINFAKHELREAELMKAGKTYEQAHEAVLKEQGMYHKGYEKKLYTEDAIKAGNAQMEKEVLKK